MNIFDEKGFSLLHKSASQNSYKLVEFFLNYIRKSLVKYLKVKQQADKNGSGEDVNSIKQKVKETARLWIDRQTDNSDGFTALHYASFHGNVKALNLLVKSGANIFARN